MAQKLLAGDVIEVNREGDDAVELRLMIRKLESSLSDAQSEKRRVEDELSKALRALQALQRQLGPLHQALRAIFGEIEIAIGDRPGDVITENIGRPMPARDNAKLKIWENWKQKLGATAAKIITALLEHGELDTQQLATVTMLHRTTIPKGIYQLNKNGLISKNGNRFSLKEI